MPLSCLRPAPLSPKTLRTQTSQTHSVGGVRSPHPSETRGGGGAPPASAGIRCQEQIPAARTLTSALHSPLQPALPAVLRHWTTQSCSYGFSLPSLQCLQWTAFQDRITGSSSLPKVVLGYLSLDPCLQNKATMMLASVEQCQVCLTGCVPNGSWPLYGDLGQTVLRVRQPSRWSLAEEPS